MNNDKIDLTVQGSAQTAFVYGRRIFYPSFAFILQSAN